MGRADDADTSAIHDALAARLGDPNADTRGEALIGLALRQDARVIAPLLAALDTPLTSDYPLAAAAELGDPRRYPALRRIQANWTDEHDYQYQALEEALERCQESANTATQLDT